MKLPVIYGISLARQVFTVLQRLQLLLHWSVLSEERAFQAYKVFGSVCLAW